MIPHQLLPQPLDQLIHLIDQIRASLTILKECWRKKFSLTAKKGTPNELHLVHLKNQMPQMSVTWSI
jgi:hypothetical protein